jgi:hypothetical protein
MANSTLNTIIKSLSLVVETSTSPVVVIGLPRSGSSYLSHVLSCLDGWFVFDDLYPRQKAAQFGINRTTNLAENPSLLESYINALTWQLRARIKHEENFRVPDLTWDDTFNMQKAVLQAFEAQNPVIWPQVLEEWMTRLTLHLGKSHWGYKTPQDFMHMDELADLFPGIKFIFIMRDPRQMMRSFKNLPRVKISGTQDGVSRQYHPVVYALYWQQAYEKVQEFMTKGRAPVEVVKFEDLVQNPTQRAENLARFLETEVKDKEKEKVVAQGKNSSFKQRESSKPVRELTNTEVFLCEKIAGSAMQASGYDLHHPTPNPLDMIDLISTSATFTGYQVQRILASNQARTSVSSFVKNLLNLK